jgi:hypothetical protein
MPTLQGKWYFNAVISEIPDYETVTFQFNIWDESHGGLGMDWRSGDGLMYYVEHDMGGDGSNNYVGEISSPPLYNAGEHHWVYPECRLIDFGVYEQPVSVDFYTWLQQNAIPYNNLNNYVQIKGKWYFKENINLETLPTDQGSQIISFTTSVASGSSSVLQHYNGFSGSPNILGFRCDAFESYDADYVYQTEYLVGPWVGWRDGNASYRDISFGDEVQYVTKEFYNWFTKNAVPLTVEGIWRFNKDIQFPTQNISINSDTLFFKSNGFEGTILQVELDRGLIWYVSTMNGGVADNNVYKQNTWINEAWREIEFLTTTEISPEFAIWFFENAHPTEVVICSEAYVAEIAHNIRQIKGTTQKYAVKNLANEIRNLYINANEEVY